jgi:hypothetical protein
MDFPRLVYKSAEEHTVADTKEEFTSLIKDGWFASVPEALDGKHAAVAKPEVLDETSPPSRAELEQKAKELKIKFNAKTTDDELNAAIAEKL